MKNLYKLVGNLTRAHSAKVPLVIIALVAVIGFSMAACGDDNGDGGPTYIDGVTVTFSLDKVDATSFTATVEGANWDSDMGDHADGSTYSGTGSLFDSNQRTVSATGTNGGTQPIDVLNAFSIERTSGTLLTITLKTQLFSSVSGTIAINTIPQMLQSTVDVPLEESVGNNKYRRNTYTINPAKASITF